MNVRFDGAEIDRATYMEVYGEWIKFIDGEGSPVKIPPHVVRTLMVFALNNVTKFEEGAWDD